MPTMLHMWSTGQEIYELVDKADKDGGALGRELIFLQVPWTDFFLLF